MKPVLYSYFRSSASWRVRIALAVKGIDYEYRPVHLLRNGGEQKTPEYAALNPSRLVPTLEIDGQTLGESMAIIEYLEETRPTPALLPAEAGRRALARQIAEVVNAGIQPLQNLRVLGAVAELSPSDPDAKSRWASRWITMGLVTLEELLGRSEGRYCVGDSVTIADVFLAPQLGAARRFGVPVESFPRVSAVGERLGELAAFRSSEPSSQPDFEG